MTFRFNLALFLTIAVFPVIVSDVSAQEASTTSAGPQTFVFIQRASSHVKYSKSDVFQEVVSDLLGYFKTKNVAMATDQFGNRTNSEDQMPLATVQNIARDSGATHLVYVLVERPMTKWIKITIRCYDAGGKQLWEEEASNGGGMSGGHGLRASLDSLHEKLDKRLGQAGLPVLPAAASATPASSAQ